MASEDRQTVDSPEFASFAPVRAAAWLVKALRPANGWLVLLLTAGLAMTPAWAMQINHWVRLQQVQNALALTGLCAVLWVWWAAGWKRSPAAARYRLVQVLFLALTTAIVGAALLSVLLVRWLPSPPVILSAARTGTLTPVASEVGDAVAAFQSRLSVWWIAATSGGGARDELIFAVFAGGLLWLCASATAALIRRRAQGLAAALPILALTGFIVFYGGQGRLVFLAAMAIALALQIALDNRVLEKDWVRRGLDYSGDVFQDRWLNSVGVCAAALLIAGITPSLSLQRLADVYAQWTAPIDQRMEGVRKQAFANVETATRYSLSGTITGLPNSFLLGAGPELDNARILQLRTSDPLPSYDGAPPDVYLRAMMLERYTGHGWERPDAMTRTALAEYERRGDKDSPSRRMLAQTIRLYRPSRVLFAAGEPIEVSVPTWDERDPQGELVTVAAGAGAYTVVSAIPAVDQDALRSIPFVQPADLPDGFDAFLALPASVTQRTRDLAHEITRDAATPYDVALAIETYLRRFPYDTTIPAPPANVTDIADYFLFDLQRGYCDYYATAFVVLARAAGLPSRFVAGYAPGTWQPNERSWNVTAADAHAWPEVWYPDVGWIAFEPTASRPTLVRLGSGSASTSLPPDYRPSPAETARAIEFNWQMLFWLLPAAAIVWGAWAGLTHWRAARADPWLTLQAWGAARGRPQSDSETPTEYGAALAGVAQEKAGRATEAARIVEREAPRIGAAVSDFRYAPEPQKSAARNVIGEHWLAIRGALPRIRRGRRKPNPM